MGLERYMLYSISFTVGDDVFQLRRYRNDK